MACTDSGAQARICATQRATAASSSARGTTSLTRPISSALLRLDALAGEQHAHRLAIRNLALQQRHAAVERQAADQRLGQAEARFLAGHHDVAAEHHLEAAAERIAVDARDHRHVERLAQRDAAEAAGPRRAQ